MEIKLTIVRLHLIVAYLLVLMHTFVPHHHHADRSAHFTAQDCPSEESGASCPLSNEEKRCSLLKETVSSHLRHIKWEPHFDGLDGPAYLDLLQCIFYIESNFSVGPGVEFDRLHYELRSLEACGLRGPPRLS